jgi:hypothetical protein
VARYLADKHKIPVSKIRAIGYGETRPIADNGNYQGREQNRRVEFQVTRSKTVERLDGNHMDSMGSKNTLKKKVVPQKAVKKTVKKAKKATKPSPKTLKKIKRKR